MKRPKLTLPPIPADPPPPPLPPRLPSPPIDATGGVPRGLISGAQPTNLLTSPQGIPRARTQKLALRGAVRTKLGGAV